MADLMSIEMQDVTGVILAGGQARRMGGIDKGLVRIAGRSMCEIVMQRLAPQVGELLINANRRLEEYRSFEVPVIQDQLAGYLGPLAGLASAMHAARLPWVITAPCDGPFLNHDYVSRMLGCANGKIQIVVAADAKRMQPTFMLAHASLLDDLSEFLVSGERKIDKWFGRHRYAIADFSDSQDCFLNINTDADCAAAERRLAADER